MCESASAAAVAAAESDTEAQSKAEAATGGKLTESPVRSAPSSPQSSFPGFMPAHPAQDADSPLQTAAPLVRAASSPVANSAQGQGPLTPDRPAGNAWGALFSPERSPAAGVEVTRSILGPPIESQPPMSHGQVKNPPPPTGMPPQWDALFSASPGGAVSPQGVPEDTSLSAGISPAAHRSSQRLSPAADPRAAHASSPLLGADQSADGHVAYPLQGADHATAEPERSGGFVALLEASLTELSGTSQELLRPAAASQSHGHTQTQATAGSEVTLHISAIPQPTPELSISPEFAMVPNPQGPAELSPLSSEATFSLQQEVTLQAPMSGEMSMGTPSWGWGQAGSPQQASLAASPGPALVLRSGGDSFVPASPAESVGSATGPQDRPQEPVDQVSLIPLTLAYDKEQLRK